MLKAYDFIEKKLKAQRLVKERVEKVFLEVVPQIDEIIKLKNEDKITEKLFAKILKISNKIDKAKDFIASPKYKRYIETIVQISIYYQELEFAKISVAPSDTPLEKTKKLAEWVEHHKYWLFSVAGGLNADIETTKKASRNLIREMKKRKLI